MVASWKAKLQDEMFVPLLHVCEYQIENFTKEGNKDFMLKCDLFLYNFRNKMIPMQHTGQIIILKESTLCLA